MASKLSKGNSRNCFISGLSGWGTGKYRNKSAERENDGVYGRVIHILSGPRVSRTAAEPETVNKPPFRERNINQLHSYTCTVMVPETFDYNVKDKIVAPICILLGSSVLSKATSTGSQQGFEA
jgi:hypothetical protein